MNENFGTDDSLQLSMEDKKRIQEQIALMEQEDTPEEIAKRKKEFVEEAINNGFLPISDEYHDAIHCSQEIVEENPSRFIITECLPACKELWRKNIYTFMVSDYLDVGHCWIEIVADTLSDDNKLIYGQMKGNNVIKFSYHKDTLNFGINEVGKEGQLELLELAKQFQMQDVPKGIAYISVKDFLMDYCDCYDVIPNPKYKPKNILDVETSEDLLEFENWQDSLEGHPTIHKFNPSKVNEPINVLVAQNHMIMEDDRIYLSQFHYQKHQKYVEYIQNVNQTMYKL